ncbi:MAG: OmpA family protein [Brevirhabdus sp.]
MTRKPAVIAALLAGTMTLTACEPGYLGQTYDPNDPNAKTRSGAIIGGIAGGLYGLTRDGDNKLLKGAVGAGIGAAVGGSIGALLDRQAADLATAMGNDDVTIRNTGSELIVTMPQDILFDVDSTYVNPSLENDLRAVAQNLNKYPDSTVVVVGHTDNTGSAEYNQDLSARRAGAVASILINSGVDALRVTSVGRGEDQPVASNLTEEGKAKNRRVEIVIRPNT